MQEVPILARKCASVLDQDAKTDIFSLLKVNEGAVTVGRISLLLMSTLAYNIRYIE
jgi:hypothetical protein